VVVEGFKLPFQNTPKCLPLYFLQVTEPDLHSKLLPSTTPRDGSVMAPLGKSVVLPALIPIGFDVPLVQSDAYFTLSCRQHCRRLGLSPGPSGAVTYLPSYLGRMSRSEQRQFNFSSCFSLVAFPSVLFAFAHPKVDEHRFPPPRTNP